MANQVLENNLKLVRAGMNCENDKPITCLTGSAYAAVIDGMTVAQFIADPIEGARAAIRTIRKIQDEGGPIHSFNNVPGATNIAAIIGLAWNSRVLIPGIDLPENSVWQIKEECLVGREAYDQIMAMGYDNYINANIMPRIVDFEYFGRYMGIAAQGQPEFDAVFEEWGAPLFMGAQSTGIPFEGLCGMRTMQEFYMDCYKIPDKLKEVSDFIFEEKYAQTEEALKAPRSPISLGGWVGGWRTASAMVNPKIWESLVWPYMKRSAEQMVNNGAIAVMHLDSSWDRDIERFGELPQGMTILNTDAMTSLPNARAKLPKMPLMGDVPPSLLTTGTPQQVTDYVNRLIDECGPQGMFICPACDTPVNAKYENMVAMVKATNDWS